MKEKILKIYVETYITFLFFNGFISFNKILKFFNIYNNYTIFFSWTINLITFGYFLLYIENQKHKNIKKENRWI